MAFLVVLDGSINFDALRLEMLQAQMECNTNDLSIYMYDVTPENKNMYV